MNWQYDLFVLLTLLLTAGLAVAAVQTARLLREWRPPRNPLLYPSEFAVRLVLCGVCVLLGMLSGAGPAALGWQVHSPSRDVFLGIGVGLLVAAGFYVSTRWLTARTGERFYSPIIVDLIAPRTGRELALVALAIVPAVLLEELLFRSLWIGGFGLTLPEFWLVLAGGVIFGLMHSPQGAWGMAGAALAGLLFGALFVWSGSLLLPLVAHYVANAVQLAAARSVTGDRN